jgi:sulfite exporter TauE/SafE
LRYQVGRATSYGFLGAMSGHLGHALRLSVPDAAAVWVVAPLTAAACMLTARSLLRRTPAVDGLVQLKSTRPRASLFAVLLRLVPREPLVLGMLSALLPCGVLASSLLAAVATGDAWSGMSLMLAFAAVSGAAVWGASAAMQLAPRSFNLSFRRALACALFVFAGLTLYRPIRALTREPHASVHHAACHDSTH